MSQIKTKLTFKSLVVLAVAAFFTTRADAFLPLSNHIYPTDECHFNCDSDDSIHQNLIQNFKHVEANSGKNLKGPLNEIMTPDTIAPGDAPKTLNKMADRSVKYFWENSAIKKSSIGRTVEQAQKSLQQEVSIHTGKTEQKINFVIDAFQSAARIQYSGYTNAELTYETRESSVGLRMHEKISENTNLILGEVVKPNDHVSQVLFNWNW